MTMLRPDELLASPVVANATMNRERGLSGVNSYERDLRFSITEFLAERVRERGGAVWYDACCGQGRALVEAGRQFADAGWGRQVRIVGVDLVPMFTPETAPNVSLQAADVATFSLEQPADLVTCVHGLHYLGDKLGFLQNTCALLAPGGLFLGHLDPNNVLSMESGQPVWRQAARHAAERGAALGLKRHVLRVKQTDAPLGFGMAYRGATVSKQPNYTGIVVINSWYAMV
jgi:trans-aconitate methyltransferase